MVVAGDDDFEVHKGVSVNNADAGSCQDCTCLQDTCYCKAAACGAPKDQRLCIVTDSVLTSTVFFKFSNVQIRT